MGGISTPPPAFVVCTLLSSEVLTNLQIKNFKRLENVAIELGKTVVFIGPNNSGKTTALQALALWEIGLRKWVEKRSAKDTPETNEDAMEGVQVQSLTSDLAEQLKLPAGTQTAAWNFRRQCERSAQRHG